MSMKKTKQKQHTSKASPSNEICSWCQSRGLNFKFFLGGKHLQPTSGIHLETGANRLSDVYARVMPETDAPFPIFMLFKNSCVARGEQR